MFMLNRKIPTVEFPSIHEFTIDLHDEPLVSLTKAGFKCDSQYYSQGIAGSLKDCYARSGVVGKLLIAQTMLPKGLQFKIYDAYRPICVQQRLWNYYRREIQIKNPGLTDEELDKRTSFFVSRPSY